MRAAARGEVEDLRRRILERSVSAAQARSLTTVTRIARAVEGRLRRLLEPSPRTVVNATGVVVHTNLGRSVLSPAAAERVARAARGYLDLEYDVAAGARGSRLSHLRPLMAELFPEHDFVAVNNNAAAIMLCLHALACGKQVIVSRGELVEIGGSFRIPDILRAAGARLKEVGTTNRTRVGDYRAAIGRRTAMLLKVHTSNFKIVGFSEETSVDALAEEARRHRLPLVVDWGSGDLVDLEPLRIFDEQPVARILERGADLVTFSCDKLLGGPQAGMVVGRADLIAKLRRDPLARVCRLDRLQIAALHETLSSYVRGTHFDDVPTLRMLRLGVAEIEARARAVRDRVARRARIKPDIRIVRGVSRTGGGSSPVGERPTRLLSIGVAGQDAASLDRRLRAGEPPVVARVRDGRLLIDLRTVLPEQDAVIARALARALSELTR